MNTSEIERELLYALLHLGCSRWRSKLSREHTAKAILFPFARRSTELYHFMCVWGALVFCIMDLRKGHTQPSR
jgi:hypothetical protein